MEACTKGKVISTNRLWWLKINKKPIRTHLLDGADFPTVITVQYSVSGVNYKKRKFIFTLFYCAVNRLNIPDTLCKWQHGGIYCGGQLICEC